MSKYAIALGGVILALAAQVLAQSQDTCKSKMTPSVSLLKRIDRAMDRYKGSAALAPIHLLDEQTLWTCSKDTEQTCCQNIPLTVLLDQTGTVCAVAFPYGELTIKRDNGNFKPKLGWVLMQAANPPAYVFGTDGIEIVPAGTSAPPVDTSGADKCKYDGSFDRYRCKDNGKNKAKAGHIANVFPVGQVDDPAFRCGNIDPTISNTN